ncbi:MAG: SusC/RagA family TonB-linked outer membrane protein [Ginsengibacter sp.]
MRKFLMIFSMLMLCGVFAFAQNRTVTGTVTDVTGAPVPYATVTENGTRNATTADANGNFTLKMKGNGAITFTATGFDATSVTPSGNNVNASLKRNSTELETVVVATSLGLQRNKNTLPYAVQRLAGDEVSKTRNDNFMSGLSGKISGLQVTQNNSLGASTNVVIRGYKSLTGSNQALFVVDGTPVDNANKNTTDQKTGRGGYDYGNAAADINADDIESINVLKGAAATALYGSRAANGVILITTKKGRKGLHITLNSGASTGSFDKSTFVKYQHEYGGGYGARNHYGSPDGNFFYFDVNGDGIDDLVDPTTEDASWGAKFDPNLLVYQWDAFDKTSPNYKKATPWVAAKNDPTTFFEKPTSFNNSILLDGGDDKFNFKLGYTHSDDKGILPNSKLTKDLVNFGATYKISDKVTANASINYSEINGLGRYGTGYDSKNPMQGFRQWYQMNNDMKELKDAYFRTRQNITWNWADPQDPAAGPIFWNNPYFDRYENYENDSRGRYFGNVGLVYKVTDWLTAQARVSLDSYDEMQEERLAVGGLPFSLAGGTGNDASGYSRLNRSFKEYNYSGLLNFDKNVTNDLNVKALAGADRRQNNISSILAATNGGLVVPKFYALSNSLNPISAPVENLDLIQVDGIFAGATLTWKEMLILDATIRRDHSSTLPKDNASYNYPSVSTGLIFSKLVHNAPWLTYGKVRANYAELGNSAPTHSIQDIYTALPSYGSATLFAVPGTKNNEKLRPERTKSYELGLEMNFLKNRLGFDVTYYDAKSVDQILPVAVSTATGYDFEYINSGVIQNKGWEVTLNLTPLKSKDFRWDVKVNWTKNNNKVLSLFGPDSSAVLQLGSFQGGVSVNAVPGQPYGQIRGSDFIYTNGQRTVLANGRYDKTSTSNNVIGNASPDWLGGINNTFTYNNISLSFLIDVRRGGDIFSLDTYYGLATGLYDITAGKNDLGNDVRAHVADGGGVILPGVTADGKPNTTRVNGDLTFNGEQQSYFGIFGYVRNPAKAFVYDASYVKLREVVLSYSLPATWITKTKVFTGIDISVYGRNLWIIHKNMPYSDPEELLSSGNIQGYQSGAYPSTRTIGFNVNFKF